VLLGLSLGRSWNHRGRSRALLGPLFNAIGPFLGALWLLLGLLGVLLGAFGTLVGPPGAIWDPCGFEFMMQFSSMRAHLGHM
jgi:hypothetical protein